VAIAILVVLLILIVIGVHSCDVSQANSDLRNYAVSVNSVMQASQQTSQRLFTLLSSGQGSNNASNLESQVDTARLSASGQLSRAQNLNTPGQLQTAQQQLVLALRMRLDGISNIAQQLPAALQPQTASTATSLIAAEMARFYSSDVLYKDYTLPKLVNALKQAGIAVGGTSGEPIFEGQFLPNVQWLTPSFVATELKSPGRSSGTTPKSGAATYTVVAGDTLSGIAAKTGVPLSKLESLNPGVNPAALQTGQQLKLR
jgi:LysM repeat protein